MKIFFLLPAAFDSLSQTATAQTITEDFTSGLGLFTALSSTDTSTSTGRLEFVNTNNQGAGVTFDLNDAFGAGFSNFAESPLFFQFNTLVPAPSSAQDELGFFFGPFANQAQSSSITNGQNTNGFTFFFNDGGLVVPNNNQGPDANDTSPQTFTLLNGLNTGSQLTLGVEWSLVPAQNTGQFNSIFTLTASDTSGVLASQTFNGAVNQGITNIDNFQFTASTTQGLTGSIDDFTVSTDPITSIPEPSSFLLSLIGLPALFWRRRHA